MNETFDRDSWERRWSRALHDSAHAVAQRPPSAHLLREAADLRPGRALDAGAGWEILVAEDRPRDAAGSGAAAVVRATAHLTGQDD